MALLHREAGVNLFLFQDEFFVSGKKQVLAFCRALEKSGLDVEWKAFGRVNLTDEEMMRAMADAGCLELRFGIESGSDRVLKDIRKGFTATESVALIPKAVGIFPRVDAFYVCGFPFETMADFNQTLFQMVSFRMMGVRILPSLLSFLPQTPLYEQWGRTGALEFCPYLLPEFVLTGHETLRGCVMEMPERHRHYFDLITANPDIFPGFTTTTSSATCSPNSNCSSVLAFISGPSWWPNPMPKAAARTLRTWNPLDPQRRPLADPQSRFEKFPDAGRSRRQETPVAKSEFRNPKSQIAQRLVPSAPTFPTGSQNAAVA